MDFTFNEEQDFFQHSLRDFLRDNVTAESIRKRWDSDNGFDRTTWKGLAELGLTAAVIAEEQGGLGLTFEDCVLLMQECGRAALPEPLIDSSFVAASLLQDIYNKNANTQVAQLLEEMASGEKIVLCSHALNPFVNMAQNADYFLMQFGDDIHLVKREDTELTAHKSLDPSRRPASISWQAGVATCLIDGKSGSALWRKTLNRAALANAAQMLGASESMVAQAVKYTTDREQFGKPIGSNQAVKHLLADCAVKAEFAKPVIYRAAYTVSVAPERADWAVSHAKTCAAEAGKLAARNCIQSFGAMGYTWECDLHIWTKRVWALDKEWGDDGFHKNRIHEWLLQPKALLGPEFTFGRRYLGDATETV